MGIARITGYPFLKRGIMFKYVKLFTKPIFDDFKHYSIVYKFWYRHYVKKCKRKLKKYIAEDRCVSLYIGLPRSGKTTFLAYLTNLCNVTGYKVFSNIPVKGALPYSKDDIGKYDMSHALILLDEAGLVYDNRQYSNEKQFTNESLQFLKLIGHYKSNICLFSQSMDIDVKWIRMSKDIFFIKRSLIKGRTNIYRVHRKLDVNPDTHKIEDFYDKPTGLLAMLTKKSFRRKPYYHMFDSYDAPKLQEFPKLKKYEPYKFN